MKTYLLTPADIKDYHDGTNGLIDQIWWEVLNELPIDLFKEAIAKGFTLLNKTPTDNTPQQKMLLYIPNASPELNAALDKLGIDINFLDSNNH